MPYMSEYIMFSLLRKFDVDLFQLDQPDRDHKYRLSLSLKFKLLYKAEHDSGDYDMVCNVMVWAFICE